MQMRNCVKYIGRFIVVDIKKPIFETETYSRVRVNKKYSDDARITFRYLLVRCPKGELVFLPKALKKMKIVKEAFLYPDNPMKMYELDIPHCKKKLDEYYQVR